MSGWWAKLVAWWIRRGALRCANDKHAWRRAQPNLQDFPLSYYYQYAQCARCGKKGRRVNVD